MKPFHLDCDIEDFRMPDGSAAKLLPREAVATNYAMCPRCEADLIAKPHLAELVVCPACACQCWVEVEIVQVWTSREVSREAPRDTDDVSIVFH